MFNEHSSSKNASDEVTAGKPTWSDMLAAAELLFICIDLLELPEKAS